VSRGEGYRASSLPESDHRAQDSLISNPTPPLISSITSPPAYLLSGPMQALLDDESIEEIWINSPNRIFIARDGRTELVPLIMSAQEIRDSVERLLAWSGRRVDLSQPFVDARLPNGSRLHVVIPDITAEFWSINIRKRALRAFTLDDLVSADSVTTNLAELLRLLINSHINVLVSGATQAGKTTILNCLLGELPITSRLITIEEVFELMPRVADHVAMQTRQANLEGEGEVTLRMLVRESLRMRPTHIVIGEVRGAEALDLLLALNSGIPGMASIHANSPLDALKKISALPLLVGANIVREFAIDAVRANVDLVIHCERDHSGKRRVMELSLVQKNGPSDSFWVDKLISWTGDKYLLSPVDLDSYPKVKVALEEFLIHTKASAHL
jgi:pilus assembly protein CpaF